MFRSLFKNAEINKIILEVSHLRAGVALSKIFFLPLNSNDDIIRYFFYAGRVVRDGHRGLRKIFNQYGFHTVIEKASSRFKVRFENTYGVERSLTQADTEQISSNTAAHSTEKKQRKRKRQPTLNAQLLYDGVLIADSRQLLGKFNNHYIKAADIAPQPLLPEESKPGNTQSDFSIRPLPPEEKWTVIDSRHQDKTLTDTLRLEERKNRRHHYAGAQKFPFFFEPKANSTRTSPQENKKHYYTSKLPAQKYSFLPKPILPDSNYLQKTMTEIQDFLLHSQPAPHDSYAALKNSPGASFYPPFNQSDMTYAPPLEHPHWPDFQPQAVPYLPPSDLYAPSHEEQLQPHITSTTETNWPFLERCLYSNQAEINSYYTDRQCLHFSPKNKQDDFIEKGQEHTFRYK